MTRYAKHVNTRETPQTEKASPKQKKNNAEGYSFTLDSWGRLDRWLILGAEGGTYYASERKLTQSNAETVSKCVHEDGLRTVRRIVELSSSGRAPKNDPAIFALAIAASAEKQSTREAALAAISQVCRTGTHLFQFVQSVRNFRGWGRGLRKAVSKWYTNRSIDSLGYQVVKYQQREGMSHRDVLRLAGGEMSATTPAQQAVFRWIVAGIEGMGKREVVRKGGKSGSYPALDLSLLPRSIEGWEKMKKASSAKEAAKLIREYNLTHEMVLSSFKNDPLVWEALLDEMPITALIRNLGKLSSLGLLKPFSTALKSVEEKLSSKEILQKGRVHPVVLLNALGVYNSGHGVKGSLSWEPVAQVSDALEAGFYESFGTVTPSGKNTLIALDVSGSMTWGNIAGLPTLTPRTGSAAMAMVTARTERQHHIMGFSNSLVPIKGVSARSRLDDVVRAISAIPMGGTDCSLPMTYALKNKLPVEHFVVYTDNETWAGAIHPHQALRKFRDTMGINAKLTVVGMTATEFTIADPSDRGMLDVVGFDSNAPAIISDFAKEGF